MTNIKHAIMYSDLTWAVQLELRTSKEYLLIFICKMFLGRLNPEANMADLSSEFLNRL